ncbi:DoxX family protein [Candidatus Uhrbacteria bacterium]|nr:DoxX family protein [Candidatus Uhrbacteria bacterium]
MVISERRLHVLMTLFKTRPVWGFIPLRIVFGSLLLVHGASRLIAVRQASGTFLADLPSETAYGIVLGFAVIEFVGGVLMIPGFLTRLAGFLLVIEMIVSITIERLPLGFEEIGLSFELLLFAVAGMFLISGAGRFSVDRAIAKRLLCHCPDEKHEAYIVAETIYTRWFE